MTGPLGIAETYNFITQQNKPKVSEIDRAANGSVTYASEGFVYDSNGYLANVEGLERQQHILRQQQPRPADPDRLCQRDFGRGDDQHHL